jgi:hypothetical protein
MKNVLGVGLAVAGIFIGMHLGRLILVSFGLPNDGDPPLGARPGGPLSGSQMSGSGRRSAAPVAKANTNWPASKQGRR